METNLLVRCKECSFWVKDGRGKGECHREAPKPACGANPDTMTVLAKWPTVSPDNFCGQGIKIE